MHLVKFQRAQVVKFERAPTGALFTRLVADVCPSEMKAVAQADGSQGIKIAFEVLGRLAMQELMSNQQVSQTIGGFERYVDRAKTDRVLRSK